MQPRLQCAARIMSLCCRMCTVLKAWLDAFTNHMSDPACWKHALFGRMLDRVVQISLISTAEECSRIALQIGESTAQQPQSLAARLSTCPVGGGLEPTDRTGRARTDQIKAHQTGNAACSRTGGQNAASLLIRKLILGRPCVQPGERGDSMTEDCLVRKCCCVQVWYSCCRTKIQRIQRWAVWGPRNVQSMGQSTNLQATSRPHQRSARHLGCLLLLLMLPLEPL